MLPKGSRNTFMFAPVGCKGLHRFSTEGTRDMLSMRCSFRPHGGSKSISQFWGSFWNKNEFDLGLYYGNLGLRVKKVKNTWCSHLVQIIYILAHFILFLMYNIYLQKWVMNHWRRSHLTHNNLVPDHRSPCLPVKGGQTFLFLVSNCMSS